MINLSRSTLLTGIAALSSIALNSQVRAQTANVDFFGVVPPSCAVNSITGGTLTNIINGTVNPLKLETNTVGNINVSCNSRAFSFSGVKKKRKVIFC